MHFYLDKNLDFEFVYNNFSNGLEFANLEFGNELRYTSKGESSQGAGVQYTTITWFGNYLAEKYRTYNYKMCRITIGNRLSSEFSSDGVVQSFSYLSIDISFIKSAVVTKGTVVGYFFYDVDEDNDQTPDGLGPDGLDSKYSWRFLETAPKTGFCAWGPEGTVTGANGEPHGWGENNTVTITETIGEDTENNYAALMCKNFEDGFSNNEGYSAPFGRYYLPNLKELKAIYDNLVCNNLGGLAEDKYWSSLENDADNAYYLDFSNAQESTSSKDCFMLICPIRQLRK